MLYGPLCRALRLLVSAMPAVLQNTQERIRVDCTVQMRVVVLRQRHLACRRCVRQVQADVPRIAPSQWHVRDARLRLRPVPQPRVLRRGPLPGWGVRRPRRLLVCAVPGQLVKSGAHLSLITSQAAKSFLHERSLSRPDF